MKRFQILTDLFIITCKKCGSNNIDLIIDHCNQCGDQINAICNDCKSEYDCHKFISIEDNQNENKK